MGPTRPRVLVIDDDEAMRELLNEVLRSRGVEADTAATAVEGLALFARHDYDLVLTDYAMPGMSGVQVVDIIKKNCPQMPIVILSGSFTPDELESHRTAGYRILTKPVSLQEFDEALLRLLPSLGSRIAVS